MEVSKLPPLQPTTTTQEKGSASLILSTSQHDLNVKSRALYIIPGSQVSEGSLTCCRGEEEVWCRPKRRASYEVAGVSERVGKHMHSRYQPSHSLSSGGLLPQSPFVAGVDGIAHVRALHFREHHWSFCSYGMDRSPFLV